ncbi:MAG: methyltransferase domain-containing protein [Erysipelotrichaceae bacterium]|nr:methyltransferase domain-containing protein [Erysipelotrichaceae bacterium]
MALKTNYEKWYETEDYFWGTEPAELCQELIKLVPPAKGVKVLDIGCGEGKDAVFMAKQGYDVYAFDITVNGIAKTRRMAKENNVEINAFIADINDFEIDEEFDIIYSTGTIQYLEDDRIDGFFRKVKDMTRPGGINWFNVFVDKPFIPLPPDWDEGEKMWPTGKLFSYYPDWKFERVDETIFECHSSGIPHVHCMDVLVARKYPKETITVEDLRK